MSEGNGRTWSGEIKTLGDQLAGLKVTQAVELRDYLKEVYKIEPAAGGAVMMAPAGGGAAVAEKPVEKTEFTVSLDGFDAAKKINVIKVVREITGLGLKEAKDLVEGSPKPLPGKDAVTKDEAEALKKKIEEAGGKVSYK